MDRKSPDARNGEFIKAIFILFSVRRNWRRNNDSHESYIGRLAPNL